MNVPDARREQMDKVTTLAALLGETLTAINGCRKGSGRIEFVTASGRVFAMYHVQDCCESVLVEDVTGDPYALLGSPITLARADCNHDAPAPSRYAESWTWTFYNIATAKAALTIRWLGESKGYYSEAVGFFEARDAA